MTNPHMIAAVDAAAHRMLLDQPPCEYLCGCSDLPLDEAKDAIEGALPRIRAMIAQEILERLPESGPHINMTQYREGVLDGMYRAARIAKGLQQ